RARPLRAHGPRRRGQGGRWRLHHQGGAPHARAGQGDAGRRLADARPLPHRRLVAAQRPADAVRQARRRPLRARRGLLQGMTTAAGPAWQALPALERGKYLFRIARLIQERARELTVAETLDGGKPIRESRDVDVPLAAAHFFSYAGWADKLRYALAGRDFAPRG